MRTESVLICLAYILAGAMVLHVALIGIKITERAAVWAASRMLSPVAFTLEAPP